MSDVPSPPPWAALRAALLRDGDGDGFPDALAGPVWIAEGSGPDDVDAAVGAAAELLARLADRALTLPVATRRWPAARPGFAVGRDPAADDRGSSSAVLLPSGTRLTWDGAALRVVGHDGPSLRRDVLAWLGRAPTAARAAGQDPGEAPAPTIALSGGAPEALALAVRVALEALDPPVPLGAPPERAWHRVELDPALPSGAWRVERGAPPAEDGEADAPRRLRVVGADADALGHACRWAAEQHPRLADGTWLDDLEGRLGRLVRGQSRDGRLAAAASAAEAARAEGRRPRRARLPGPPADAPLRLGLPVANSARDGERARWTLTRPWEGERLRAALREVVAEVGAARGAPTDGPLRLEAYASETLAVRERLAEALAAELAPLGEPDARVQVRHAYRPALHWLLEELVPALPEAARDLEVRASRPRQDGVPAERWLRELYPLAEAVAAVRPGLRAHVALDEPGDVPRYRVVARDAAGRELLRDVLTPPVADAPLPEGGTVPVTTGGLRLWRGGRRLAERRVATDAEAFWSWLAGEILPELVGDAAAGADPDEGPLLHEVAVVARLSEPDDALPVDHETDSVTEALHEDVYFGALEAFERAHGADRPRHLAPGRILPFVHAAPGAELRAHAIRRRWGSGRVGVELADGGWRAAAPVAARVRATRIEGRGAAPVRLRLEVDPDAAEAVRRLAWAHAARPASFPAELSLEVVGEGAPEPTLLAPVARPPSTGPLPDRPLHPREVTAAARDLGRRRPDVRVALPRETALGQPLPVLETGRPAGPAVSRTRRAAWKPAVLLSARQHANEATSTQAAFGWLARLLEEGDLLARANLVVHPIENPDGARLHAALLAVAPNHMHHAARYTAFGADLQTEPRIGGRPIAESLLRRDAARRWRPRLHLNDHGYPAHAWIRSQTGFVPRGFENWSLPVGHLTILTGHLPDPAASEALRDRLAAAVEAAWTADEDLRRRTVAQVARRAPYRPDGAETFAFRSGLPFWLHHRPHPPEALDPGAAPGDAADPADRADPDDAASAADGSVGLTPLATLITEVPDETVDGARWDACVRGHASANEAVVRAFLAWWADGRPRPGVAAGKDVPGGERR